MKKTIFCLLLIILCSNSAFGLSLFTSLKTAGELKAIPLYGDLRDPNTKYWDVENGSLIEVIDKTNENTIVISTSYGYVGQLNPADLEPEFYSNLLNQIDSLPADERKTGIVTTANLKTYKEILDIANRLYKPENDELLYYLRRWNFGNVKLISAEAYNYNKNKESNSFINSITDYPCDEITVRTPYRNALLHCWSVKKDFSVPTIKELPKFFAKPQYIVIDAKLFVGSIDSGKYIMGALRKNGKIIKPIKYELDRFADTSSSWPNYPAYEANNSYYFEMSKIGANDKLEFITNDSPPLVFRIDFSKIK
jgi:hypothetical protein